MNLIYYILIVDFIILLIFIKFIFGSANIFKKAVLGHIFSDFSEDIETFKKWDKEHNIHHKMNLFYAAFLGIFGFSILLYKQL